MFKNLTFIEDLQTLMYSLSFLNVNIYFKQLYFICLFLYYEQNFKSSSSGQCFLSLVKSHFRQLCWMHQLYGKLTL